MFGIGLPELIIILLILIIVAIPAAIVLLIIWITRRKTDRSVANQGPIYCTKCGSQNAATALHCDRCGTLLQRPQLSGIAPMAQVPNYLAQAILVTIFCCIPFGIPAIVFAAQVNGKLSAGDYAGAVETSKKAKMWCWVAFLVGLGFALMYFILAFIGVIGGRLHETFYG